MTQPGIEPRCPGPLVNTVPITNVIKPNQTKPNQINKSYDNMFALVNKSTQKNKNKTNTHTPTHTQD